MRLADVFATLVGPGAPVEFVAYDGSRSGTPGSDIRIEVKSPRAVAFLASSPGQLGLARAFVSGDLDVVGDMYTALKRLDDMGAARLKHLTLADKARVAAALAPFALRRETPPPEEVRLDGGVHSHRRDADAISHHYDVSNRFYRWVLGPSMAYTCAVFPTEDVSLEEAQAEKFDLVCRKLGLRAGMRLLDVGCGWGGMVLHAVKNYGVTAIGVTLSSQQAEWGQRVIDDAGLGDRAKIRHQDYRHVPEQGFDAISSIGLTEHIGHRHYRSYFGFLRTRLNPTGRLLNHCITRTDPRQSTQLSKGFINRYVFPDGELVPVGRIIDAMEDSGFEVRHEENLREHYALTLKHWSRNLEENWDDAVEDVGIGKARVWRLYMAAARLGFVSNRIQLHQVLAVRNADDGTSDYPLRVDWDAKGVVGP